MTLNTTLLATAMVLCTSASATEIVEWRFQGPAFSHHFSNFGAPLRDQVQKDDGENALALADIPSRFGTEANFHADDTANSYCNRYAVRAVGLGAVGGTAAQQEQASAAWHGAHDSALANCLVDLKRPYLAGGSHRWNQANLEAGIERDVRDTDTGVVTRFYIGAVVDSYFKPSAYAGYSYQRALYDGPRLRVDAGVTGLLWYRTVADRDQNLRRRLLPVVLPVVSVEDKKLGVGVHLSYVPQVRSKGQHLSVDTLMLQVSWAL